MRCGPYCDNRRRASAARCHTLLPLQPANALAGPALGRLAADMKRSQVQHTAAVCRHMLVLYLRICIGGGMRQQGQPINQVACSTPSCSYKASKAKQACLFVLLCFPHNHAMHDIFHLLSLFSRLHALAGRSYVNIYDKLMGELLCTRD